MFTKGDRVELVSLVGTKYTGIIDNISGNWVTIKDEESGLITAVNAAVISLIKSADAKASLMEFSDEDEFDTNVENKRPSNPMIDKALSLAEARNEKLKLQRDGIKDYLTDKELKPVENNYAVPSFKKYTKD